MAAVPPAQNLPSGKTLVVDTVLQALKAKHVELEGKSEKIPDIERAGTFQWLPQDETLWYIMESKSDLETRTQLRFDSAKDFKSLQDYIQVGLARDEGECIVALSNTTEGSIVGYYDGALYSGWAFPDNADFVN